MAKGRLSKFVGLLDAAERALYSFSGALSGCVMVIAMCLVVYNVFIRHVFRGSAPWADEYAGYSLVVFAALAVSYTLVTGKHTRVDIVTSHLSPKTAEWLDFAVSILALPVAIMLTITTWKYAYGNLGVTSETAMGTPLFPVQVFLPVGFAFLAIALISRIVHKLRSLV